MQEAWIRASFSGARSFFEDELRRSFDPGICLLPVGISTEQLQLMIRYEERSAEMKIGDFDGDLGPTARGEAPHGDRALIFESLEISTEREKRADVLHCPSVAMVIPKSSVVCVTAPRSGI
jgi:hypothetical protein